MLMQPPSPTAPDATPYAPMSSTYVPPSRPARSGGVERLGLVLGIVIGALVITGLMSFHAALILSAACSTYPCPTLSPSQNLANGLAWVFVIAMDLAVGLSICVAFIAGGASSELSEATRRGTYALAIALLVVWVVFGTFLLPSLLSLIRY